MSQPAVADRRIRFGMVGLGMIFDETYRPLLERLKLSGLARREFGFVEVELAAVASRTGRRAKQLLASQDSRLGRFADFAGDMAVADLVRQQIDAIATPDDRHFEAARLALDAGKHVLIEKPSVLNLRELDELTALARTRGVLAKVVYHKLFDPDHKKLRTHVVDGVLRHVNNGYCSLLEPRRISRDQFAEWIQGRNPGSYVAVHYIKLIDFTFGPDWRLERIAATGQRGIVGEPASETWDSVQLQMVYRYADGREAAFDIHTSWVTPDRFPGSVEQEVQFRFDNGVWNAHQRRRGVEVSLDDPPDGFAMTPNYHFSARFLEPWGEPSHRGYGLEAIERFLEEVAFVEFGGPPDARTARLDQMRRLEHNDLSADRNVVATVQALEAILAEHAGGRPGCQVTVNSPSPGLWLHRSGEAEPACLYGETV